MASNNDLPDDEDRYEQECFMRSHEPDPVPNEPVEDEEAVMASDYARMALNSIPW